MTKHYTRYLFFFCIFLSSTITAQHQIGVNPFTGSANINIPVWNFTSGSLSYPISITYSGNGYREDSPAGRMGNGWRLNADGFIKRSIKGLPDDYVSARRLGWLYDSASVAAEIGSFTPAADNDLSDMSDESDDFEFLNALGGFDSTAIIKDTKPDIFTINVPGLYASFVFDNSGEIKFTSKNNWKIDYLKDTLGRIDAFIVIKDDGTEYYFDDPSLATIKTNGNSRDYLSDNYYLYNGGFKFNQKWYLKSIRSSNNYNIEFEYKSFAQEFELMTRSELNDLSKQKYIFPIENEITEHTTYVYDPSLNIHRTVPQFAISIIPQNPKKISSIKSLNTRIDFVDSEILLPQIEHSYVGGSLYGPRNLKTLTLDFLNVMNITGGKNELIKSLNFIYSPLSNSDGQSYGYLLLQSISEATLYHSKLSYSFEYYGVDFNNKTIEIPRRVITDTYGFINLGVKNYSLPPRIYTYPLINAERFQINQISSAQSPSIEMSGSYMDETVPHLPSLIGGSIKSIRTAKGSSSIIRYEANEYYDSLIDRSVYGGGLRVKKILTTNGLSTDNIQIRIFSYTKDGKSTGRLINAPSYGLRLNHHKNPVNDELIYAKDMDEFSLAEKEKRLTVRIKRNLKSDDPFVGYEYFTEEVSGQGKTITHFSIPIGTHTSSYDNWRASETFVAREEPVENFQTLPFEAVTGSHAYPYPDNYKYWGQGLKKYVKSYDINDSLISQINYQYADESGSEVVEGIALDKYNYPINIQNGSTWSEEERSYFLYGKYKIPVNTSMSSTVITKNYEPVSGNYNEAHTNYAQTNSDHNYTNEVVTQGADGVVYRRVTKFSADFDITNTKKAQQDDNCWALNKLKSKNRLNQPIEVMTYKTENGNTQLIESTLTLYEYDASSNNVNPKTIYSLHSPIDSASFTPAYVTNNGSLGPIGNASLFVFDENAYERVSDYGNHTYYGTPQSQLYNTKQSQSLHLDSNEQVKAKIGNANALEILFEDFELYSSFGLTYSDSLYSGSEYVDGRIDGRAFNLQSGSSYVLSGKLQNSNTSNVVSVWLKPSATSTVTLTFSDSNSTSVVVDFTLNSSGNWEYYEKSIDLSSLSSDLSVEISSNQNIILDDLLIKPEHAVVESYLYGWGQQRIAITSADQSQIIEYDGDGKPWQVKDIDGNIIEKYIYSENKIDFTPKVFYEYPAYGIGINDTIVFNAIPEQVGGVSFQWKVEWLNGTSATEVFDNFNFNTISAVNDDFYQYAFTNLGYHIVMLQTEYLGVKRKTYISVYVNDDFKAHIHSNLGFTYDVCSPKIINDCQPDPQQGGPTPVNGTLCNLILTAVTSGGSGDFDYAWTVKRWKDTSSNEASGTDFPIGGNSPTLSLEPTLQDWNTYSLTIYDNGTGETYNSSHPGVDATAHIRTYQSGDCYQHNSQ